MPHAHLAHIEPIEPDATDGCEGCLRSGGQWVHLRLCMQCGHVGCCDNSPGTHVTRHFRDAGHGVMQSFESGEPWLFGYVDADVVTDSPVESFLAESGNHPTDGAVLVLCL